MNIDKLKEMRDQHYKSTTPMDEYHTGMYNGIEYALCCLENREPNYKECEKEGRRRWRCLVIAIKAKLECVESGITTLEDEFMAHIVLPNGQTVGHVMLPQINASYEDGEMPPLLGYGG